MRDQSGFPQFVAEISSNHNKELQRCLTLIDSAAEIGCAGVKFQLFKISELFASEILLKSDEHRRRQAWELPVDYLPAIAERCRKREIELGCTPFYLNAVEELLPFVDFYKIASYELLWHELLRACAQTGKPIILSTGMATMDEVKSAVNVLAESGCKDLTILHCVSGYPTPISECNLSAIETLRSELRVLPTVPNASVGWSDHSASPAVICRAVHRWRVEMIEFHLDIDGKGAEFATGHCWLPHQMQPLIESLQKGFDADGSGNKVPMRAEASDRDWRADPGDGLRPQKHLRDLFVKVLAQMTSDMSIASKPADKPFIRRINLDEYLTTDHIWICRLLGLEPFQRHRTVRLVKQEYNSDLYSQRLFDFKDNLDDLRDKVLHGPDREIVISIKDEIFLAHVREFLAIKRQYMLQTLSKYAAETKVCELGAGFGANLLWMQTKQQRVFYGGELCDNAVALGRLLGLELERFNFYEPETYDFIKPESTVFTSHAIEQVPDAQIFIDSLRNIKNRINCVVHFEPLFRENQNDLIGLLRKRYTQINDYNRNLLECLRCCSEIEIIAKETDVFGRNPLNPTSILVWKFV